MPKFVCFFILIPIFLSNLYAQDFLKKEYDRFGVSARVGFGFAFAKEFSTCYGGTIKIVFQEYATMLDYYKVEEFLNIFGPNPNEYFEQMDLTVGLHKSNTEWGVLSFRHAYGVGIGFVSGVKRGKLLEKDVGYFDRNDYETVKFVSPGLALKMAASILIYDSIGIMADYILNLNGSNTNIIMLLGIEIGVFNRS